MITDAKLPFSGNDAHSEKSKNLNESASFKRPRSSRNKQSMREKITKLDYWLNPKPTSSNRFDILSENEETLEDPKENVPIIPKPPPLYTT